MTRYLIVLNSGQDRSKAISFIQQAPDGTRVELKAAKRTLPQNDKLWAVLSDVALQKEHHGRKYAPEVWKALFLNGWQRDVRLIPTLDGQSVMPITRTSDLSKQEMSELLEFMTAWAVENGVVLHDNMEAA